MESTGKYWVPVFNLLEDEINVIIANPKWVKAVKGTKDDTVIESIEGYQMTDAPKYRIHLFHTHMDYVTAEINDVDKMIEYMISSNPDFENAVQLLCTIPGVKRAITILSEIGTNMSQSSRFKRLCCCAGLTPGSNKSTGKILLNVAARKEPLLLLPTCFLPPSTRCCLLASRLL